MNSLNRLILSLRTAGENHKQIRTILVGVEADIDTTGVDYPLMRIFPDGYRLSSVDRSISYRFAIAVMDRHKEDFTDAVEVLSDTGLILQDIMSTLLYVYRSESVSWEVNDNAAPFYDDKTSIVAGHIINIEAKMRYERDFCSVPSNGYDFPSIDLDILVIDGGYYNSTYITPLIDGGIS
jgi:hypothetical protein